MNASGELGDGTTRDSTVPVPVTGLDSGVIQISAGGSHTCAVTDNGSALCWGSNESGQLGNGTTTDSTMPVPVTELDSGVVQISAGESHTCAVKDDGSAWCWGSDEHGNLGHGASGGITLTPVEVVSSQ